MVNRGEPLKIMLDPGHGGRDPGAVWDGVRESDIVLDIALRCRDILKKRYDIYLTRWDDSFSALPFRRQLASQVGAAVFVSIHTNAAANLSGAGYEVFTLSAQDGLSAALGGSILAQFARRWPKHRNRGLKHAQFAVLRQARPSCLVECFFLSNPAERALLRNPDERARIAEAIAWGIGNFARGHLLEA